MEQNDQADVHEKCADEEHDQFILNEVFEKSHGKDQKQEETPGGRDQ